MAMMYCENSIYANNVTIQDFSGVLDTFDFDNYPDIIKSSGSEYFNMFFITSKYGPVWNIAEEISKALPLAEISLTYENDAMEFCGASEYRGGVKTEEWELKGLDYIKHSPERVLEYVKLGAEFLQSAIEEGDKAKIIEAVIEYIESVELFIPSVDVKLDDISIKFKA